jgi:hypothetical protein
VILRKEDRNGDTMQLNVWCTTGTVGSYLNHPRQGKTQLFRRNISSHGKLRKLLKKPRAHTNVGYRLTRDDRCTTPPGSRLSNALLVLKCTFPWEIQCSVSRAAAARSTLLTPLPRDGERATDYAFVRVGESAAGADGMITSGQRLPMFEGHREVDHSVAATSPVAKVITALAAASSLSQ